MKFDFLIFFASLYFNIYLKMSTEDKTLLEAPKALVDTK